MVLLVMEKERRMNFSGECIRAHASTAFSSRFPRITHKSVLGKGNCSGSETVNEVSI